jgi:uroporphyrinogen decarboxylase
MLAPHSCRMTPRERVLAALSHRTPDRVPFAWGFGPTAEMARTLRQTLAAQGLDWDMLRSAACDILAFGPAYTGPVPANGDTFLGIWGIKTKPQSYGAGQYAEFTDFPLAGVDSVAALDRYPWPDPAAYDYAGVRALLEKGNPGRQRAAMCFVGNPFELYSWMTGLEEALTNLLVCPHIVEAALDHICRVVVERTTRTLRECGDLPDIAFMYDDLGGQHGLLIGRDTYRSVIQPYHRRLIECVRRSAPNAKVMYHSDGAVFDILPDLLDAGIDILEAVQTDADGMDPERLKRAFGDRLCFHGAISVQQLLPFSDTDTVDHECRKLVRVLGDNGGYIAALSHAIQAGTPPENVLAMLRAVLGDDDYEAALAAARC